MTDTQLASTLARLDGKPYPAYKDIKGVYSFPRFDLSIDRIQGDPFAAPSRLSIRISHEDSGLPSNLYSSISRKTGSETCLASLFSAACRKGCSRLGSGKSGMLSIDTPGQEVLLRTCVEIRQDDTVIRFTAGLPANGRRIMGRAAAQLLTETISDIVDDSLVYQNIDADRILSFALVNEDAEFLRSSLNERGLVAFVADGAILPRISGVDNHPLKAAIPFSSPDSLRTSIILPNAGAISGMGIPCGITLIVGGGYHGKSTLLDSIERGVYNHIPGDGREQVVALADSTKVRAEDGRSVAGVDLSPFITNLPGGKSTLEFSSENASGSTSQAASIVEVLETGASTLLIDEDISATNFLIRDARMQKLIAPEKEPITPFSQRVRSLYEEHSISTIIVLGGSSDYFEPAHRVIALEDYIPHDRTEDAKALCLGHDTSTSLPVLSTVDGVCRESKRFALPQSINPYKKSTPYRGARYGGGSPRKNVKVSGMGTILFGSEEIDLSLCSQIVDAAQTRAIAAALAYGADQDVFDSSSLMDALKQIQEIVKSQGLSVLEGYDLAEFRIQEFAAALNRLRSLKVKIELNR